MISQALAEYESAADRATPGRRPLVWGVHYDIDGLQLGQLAAHEIRDQSHAGKAANGVLSPFATCPTVTTSISVVDAMVDPTQQRFLYVSRIEHTDVGTMTQHHHVPYSIDDRGHTVTSPPIVGGATMRVPESILAAVSVVTSHRLGGHASYYFDEAMRAAVVFLDLLAKGRVV